MSRAAELTVAVTAPPRTAVPRSRIETLRARLATALGSVADEVPHWNPLVVTLPLLCRARASSGALSLRRGGFAWSPFFVRRTLGGAIVDECLRRHRSPAEAAAPVLDDAVATWRRTGRRRFHWEPWVAGLPPGGRANVLAEAVTWATALWSSFDWDAFPERPVVGDPAEQWTTPEARGVRLTGRVELKVRPSPASAGGNGSDPLALVSVLNGSPPAAGSSVLAYPALVSALCAPWRDAPARSVGLWPDAGHVESMEIDGVALEAAADLVVDTVLRWSRIRGSDLGEGSPTNAEPARTAAANR